MEKNEVMSILGEVISELSSVEVVVGVSNRHIHLTEEHLEQLFGRGYKLSMLKPLKQPGHFAAKECVTLEGKKGRVEGVRILGPLRGSTQVEILLSDGYRLGISPEIRDSGDLSGTCGISLIGPRGRVELNEGVIAAKRHIHMPKFYADANRIEDKDVVKVEYGGVRGATLNNVTIRVSKDVVMEMHVDIDEANATGLKNGSRVKIIRD